MPAAPPPCAAFYDSHGIGNLPILLDPGGAILQAWQVPAFPLTVIFDRCGQPARAADRRR